MDNDEIRQNCNQQCGNQSMNTPFKHELGETGIFSWNVPRITEAIVILVATMFATMWLQMHLAEANISRLEEKLAEVRTIVVEDIRDVQKEVRRMRDDFYVPLRPELRSGQPNEHRDRMHGMSGDCSDYDGAYDQPRPLDNYQPPQFLVVSISSA